MIIPSLKLSKEKLEANLIIMRKGNSLLKECAALANMTNIDFRAKVFKTKEHPEYLNKTKLFVNQTKKKIVENPNNAVENLELMRSISSFIKEQAAFSGMTDVDFRIKLFELDDFWIKHAEKIKSSIPFINAVRGIEWEMMCAFSKLIYKKANQWSKYNKELPFEDHYQEASMAMLDAIYSYDREDAQFITYAWWVIQNRLSLATNKSRLLSPLTNEAMALVNEFNKVKNAICGPSTNLEIYKKMNLSEDQIETLEGALVSVVFPNESDKEKEVSSGDYTVLRQGVDRENTVVDNCSSTESVENIKKAIASAQLTDLEKKILDSYMNKQRGFTKNVESLNPHTNKPYSNMGLHNMLKKTLNKIKTSYQKVA